MLSFASIPVTPRTLFKKNRGGSDPPPPPPRRSRVKATHHPAAAKKKNTQDAGGLEPVIRLIEGAKVMLKANLWVPAGLTNGTLGTVAGVLYSPDAAGPDTLPAAVCVEFPGYKVPTWDTWQPQVVPIPPVTRGVTFSFSLGLHLEV